MRVIQHGINWILNGETKSCPECNSDYTSSTKIEKTVSSKGTYFLATYYARFICSSCQCVYGKQRSEHEDEE